MEITLIRHAQPNWEPGGLAVDDPDLTALGKKQAECIAAALGQETFDAVLVSPLKRTLQTAEPWLQQQSRPLVTASWLREMGMPVLEGQSSAQIQNYFAQANARDPEQWWEGMPGGETFEDFYGRVSVGIETLLAEEYDVQVDAKASHRLWRADSIEPRILLFAHEGTNAALIGHLLGTACVPWLHLQYSSNWAGISRLHTTRVGDHHVWSLQAFNHIDHLLNLEENLPGRSAKF